MVQESRVGGEQMSSPSLPKAIVVNSRTPDSSIDRHMFDILFQPTSLNADRYGWRG